MNKKLIIAFVIFAAVGAGLFFLLTAGSVGVNYKTVEVQSGQVGKHVQDVGVVSSKNIRMYYGNGQNKVSQMLLQVGDRVKKGQVLIAYENNIDLEIQKVEKQIEALEASYKETLSGADAESISSARIEVSRINKNLKVAKSDKEKVQTLYKSGAASLSELEEADNKVEEIKSQLSVAQNAYNKLTKGVSEHVKAKFEAEIDVLLIGLDILEKRKEESLVFADMDGLVTEVNTFVGDKPNVASKILEIQDPSNKILKVDFMVEDAMLVKAQMPAQVNDIGLGINIEGLKVRKVHPKAFISLSELSVEENRQTVEVDLPSDTALPFGLEVETMVMIEEARQAKVIPKGTVMYKDGKQYVKVLVNGDVIEKEIQTGIQVKDNLEVIQGLEVGEQVIINYEEDNRDNE